MKNSKPIFVTAFSAIILVSCSGSKKVFTADSQMIKAPINIQKNLSLTDTELKRWSHLDLLKDTIPGMSVDRAYAELLKDKKGKKVIVGIVDSGVDIEHEDLKLAIWTNSKEIAGNGIDDDKNGYIDDVNGWNFLGDVIKETMEYERIILNKNLVDQATYLEAKAVNDKKVVPAQSTNLKLKEVLANATKADEFFVKYFKKSDYTPAEVDAITEKGDEITTSKTMFERMQSFGMNATEFKAAVQKEIDKNEAIINGDNFKTNYRKALGDNPEDITDTKYGDHRVMGPNNEKEHTLHGTHVAGIVAQGRNNNIGGDGIATNVEIMTLRAVPDGDEYDKDIALAIRYAVDNGAKVINGSFGKGFSPQKQWVFDAIKYAEKKDVLIVHAAGNDAKDIDYFNNYPNDSADKINEFADNLITVGALNFDYGKKLVATFSNIGKLNVDVFAPGVQIYATAPKNTYKFLQGTSMAAPAVAGVAALIRSYYPKLSAQQVKHILMDSGVAITSDVIVGGKEIDVRSFSNLCKSGRIVNAYNALLMAEKMSK